MSEPGHVFDHLVAGSEVIGADVIELFPVEFTTTGVDERISVLAESRNLGAEHRDVVQRAQLGYISQWVALLRQQRPDEVLVFKLFDSKPDAVQWTAHSAFAHPGIPDDAPPRESIELRTISFIL